VKKTVLATTVFLLLVTPAASEDKLMVDATFYNNSSAHIDSVEILEAERTTPLRKVSSNFTVTVVDNRSRTVTEGPVPLSFYTNVRTTEGGYTIEKERVDRRLFLEYDEKAVSIVIRNDGEKEAEIDLTSELCENFDDACSSYCDGKGVDTDCTCGDGVCQNSTNERELCLEDCRDRTEPTASGGSEESDGSEGGSTGLPLNYLAGGLGGLVLLIMAYLARKVRLE